MRSLSRWLGPSIFGAAAALAIAATSREAPLKFQVAPLLAAALIFLLRGSLGDGRPERAAIVAASVGGGLVLASLASVASYPAVAGAPFDPDFLLENLGDAVPTILRTLDPARTALAGILLAAAAVAGYRLVRFSRLPFSSRASRVALLAILGFTLAASVRGLGRHAARRRELGGQLARFPSTAGLSTRSNEPVFMLQLESVNALAEAGLTGPEGPPRGAEERIFRDGVFFPFLVAGNMMTTRGQATILCGATWELYDSVASHSDGLARRCLPDLLRQSGYHTIFFSDSPDPRFGRTAEFARAIGFDETHFGDLARAGDPVRRWGFSDDVYYGRIFDSLAARFPDPRGLFVYIAVSADHFPFDEVEQRDSDPPALAGRSFRARYGRTLADEDRALALFRKRLSDYSSGESHLFMVSDHSFPVGVNRSTNCARGATPDNYLTTMAYVPPGSRAAEFCAGTSAGELYGQESILPTVFEVLNRRRYAGSLGAALWRYPPPAEGGTGRPPCSTFSQPFDGRYVVSVRDWLAFRYSFADGSVTQVDLRRDILERNPKRIDAGISPAEFSARFGCN